jgi:uncharacterized membrane protein YphA (DoxX/SURF4 family)
MTDADRRALWIALALAFARSVLGLIFFMAGVYKVFTLGPAGHVAKFFLPLPPADDRFSVDELLGRRRAT